MYYSRPPVCVGPKVPALIDAISEVDDATPLVWENNGGCKELVLQGVAQPSRHAHCMSHYDMPARPPLAPGRREASLARLGYSVIAARTPKISPAGPS